MKRISQLFLFLFLVLVPMLFCHAYDGPGQLVTLMTIQEATDFNSADYAVDGREVCIDGNAFVMGESNGIMWVNLGADYYVEGMEILVRYEGGETKEVGIYAECYETMESAEPTSWWFNNNQNAGPLESGYWHRIYQTGGTLNAKTHFIKVRLDNIGYPAPMAVGEFKVYARPTPGVELPSSSYRILSQTNIVSPEKMVDGTTEQHAYIDLKLNGGAWIELDQEYPIDAIHVELHSEKPGGAALSFYAYGTPSGGTHEGYYERTAPPGAVVGFEKNSGSPGIDWIPYSAQFPEQNACEHHRTHWYTMTHTDGHLGQKAKYIYIYLDNSNNDYVMCIDDIRVFRSYDLTEDAITFTNGESFGYDGNVQQPTVEVKGPKKSMIAGNITYPLATISNTPYAQSYTVAEYADYKISFPVDSIQPGVYTVTVEGVGIYSGTVTKNYYIKGASEIVLDRDFVRFINVDTGAYNTHKVNIMLTTGDGAITVESSDTSLFTASLSGMTATLTKTVSYTEKTEATAYLTFRMAETEIYAATSVTIPVMFVLHYLPVGQYVDLSTATLANNSNFGSRQDGIDTDDEILNLVRDKNKGSYALTESATTRSYFDIILPEPIDICDLTIRYATSFPGNIVVYIQMSDINGEKPVPDFGTKTWCDQAHRTMRVWPQNVPVIKGVKSFRVIVDTEQPQEGQHKAHIYEVGVYSPVTRDIVVEPNPEDRFLNEVPMVQTTQVMQSHIDIMKELNVAILDNTSDPYCYTPGVLYVPQTKYFTWTHTGGTYGSAENGTYTRKSPYKDALCVLRDYFTYGAMTNGILFMRGNMTVCTGQDMVHGDNTTINVLDTNVNIITYTGDWQTGDGEKRFEHAKYVHVEEGKEAKATFNVYLAVSERIEITTDIGPYQGRANVTLSLGDTVYCTDYIDGFFPVTVQNTDTYKVSNMTGASGDNLNTYRNDYWHPGQINTFTAPVAGVYTVEITVPWDSYLVSGIGGKYTTDSPANIPCTVINKVEKLAANEEWNFSFSDSQWFIVDNTENARCTVALDNGDVLITVTDADHHVYSADYINIDASLYKGIEIIEKYDVNNLYYPLSDGGEKQEVVQVFFRRTDMTGFSGDMQSFTNLPAANSGDQYVVHYISFEDNPEWYGTIRRFRFDFNNDSDGWHRIRAIRLVEK